MPIEPNLNMENDVSLCPVCRTFETDPGWYACPTCLDEHGEEPAKLEAVAVNLASRRRDRALRLTRDGLIRALSMGRMG